MHHRLKSIAFLFAIALFAVLVFLGLYQANLPLPDQIQGMVDTDEIRVGAKVVGRIESLLVAEGDLVHAGQVLARMGSPDLDAKILQLKAQSNAARARAEAAETGTRAQDIAAARASWLAAQTSADYAATTLKRMQRLHDEGVIARQRLDEAAAAAKSSLQIATAAQQTYAKAMEGSRPEDKAAASALAEEAAAGVLEIEAIEKELTVLAPIDGQITSRSVNQGELVPAGYPVFAMMGPEYLWVSFNVREDQFNALKITQRLSGTVPALNNLETDFEVYFISPRGDFATWRAVRQSEGFDVRTFEVRLRPTAPVDGLRPGMSVLFAWPQSTH